MDKVRSNGYGAHQEESQEATKVRARLAVLTTVLLFIGSVWSYGLELGGGISVFIPESLYKYHQGSISVETNLQWTLGLSKYLSIPIGVDYNKVYGLMVSGTGAPAPTQPWFMADSIMPYAMLKLHLPLWIFYLDLFGGGALNWNATLTPVGQNIESYLAAQAGPNTDVSLTNPTYANGLGFGWLAGAGFGVTIKNVKIDITGTYRDLSSALGLGGSYYVVNHSGGTPTVSQASISWTNTTLLLRGISIGLNGTFSF